MGGCSFLLVAPSSSSLLPLSRSFPFVASFRICKSEFVNDFDESGPMDQPTYQPTDGQALKRCEDVCKKKKKIRTKLEFPFPETSKATRSSKYQQSQTKLSYIKQTTRNEENKVNRPKLSHVRLVNSIIS